jgi:hypothetical protein
MSFSREFESEEELELQPLQSYAVRNMREGPEEPFPWPQWPKGRTLNPPLQTIPSGPFKTSAPCEASLADFSKLMLAVGDLKNLLRQKPPKLRLIRNRADIVTALARQVVGRLQRLFYQTRACTQRDLAAFASAVNTMRGPGGDADAGSWPPATTPAARGPRRQARESLRHLLNWLRRAAQSSAPLPEGEDSGDLPAPGCYLTPDSTCMNLGGCSGTCVKKCAFGLGPFCFGPYCACQ